MGIGEGGFCYQDYNTDMCFILDISLIVIEPEIHYKTYLCNIPPPQAAQGRQHQPPDSDVLVTAAHPLGTFSYTPMTSRAAVMTVARVRRS